MGLIGKGLDPDLRPFGERVGSLYPGPGGRGKHRPEVSRGPGVVFRMTAGDPEWSICSLMELSGESRKIMTVSDMGIWRDREEQVTAFTCQH